MFRWFVYFTFSPKWSLRQVRRGGGSSQSTEAAIGSGLPDVDGSDRGAPVIG